MLLREIAPEEVTDMELVCGEQGDSGSTVTREHRVGLAKQVTVVEPAATNEEVKNILGGRSSIANHEDAEQNVLSWLSALPPIE